MAADNGMAGANTPTGIPARKIIDRLIDVSPVAHHWGIKVIEAERGSIAMEMLVRPDMTNTHGACHGGVIFSLADFCFGFAANSHNDRTAASSCEIKFLSPGKVGDMLTARSTEVWKRGRGSYYDVSVKNQDGELVAIMRAQARMIGGLHIEDC